MYIGTTDLCVADFSVVPRRGLLSLLHDRRYCDVSFIVDGQCFPAHKVIVAAQSEFFDRLGILRNCIVVNHTILSNRIKPKSISCFSDVVCMFFDNSVNVIEYNYYIIAGCYMGP